MHISLNGGAFDNGWNEKVEFNKPELQGELTVPGDKSISHRAVMLGSIAEGKTKITGFLDGEDCLHTIDIFRQLGVVITREGTNVTVESPGMRGWQDAFRKSVCR